MKRVVKTLNTGYTAKEILCFVSQKVLQNVEELEGEFTDHFSNTFDKSKPRSHVLSSHFSTYELHL